MIGRPVVDRVGSSRPVISGLARDGAHAPRDFAAATTAAARTVLPTPVSVPVTKQPRSIAASRCDVLLGAARASDSSESSPPARCRRHGSSNRGRFQAAVTRRFGQRAGCLPQLRLAVRSHHRSAQPGSLRRAPSAAGSPERTRRVPAPPRRPAPRARRRRRSAARCGCASHRRRSPRLRARRAASRRWPGARRRGGAAPRATPARPAQRRPPAAEGAVEKMNVRAALVR